MEREGFRKRFGSYYTPPALANRICRWALAAEGGSVLDPACGDGAFLFEASRLAPDRSLTGVDIDSRAIQAARTRLPQARLILDDFFHFARRAEKFDAVVGNPPFVRFQNFEGRSRVARLLSDQGTPLPETANMWAAFALLAASLVRSGGRMAIVVPREALFADYAASALSALRKRFARVETTPLEGFHFDSLQKVALLRCDRAGGTSRPAIEDPYWRAPELAPAEREAFERALRPMIPLSSWARIRTGVVTGDQSFFVLDSAALRRSRLGRDQRIPVLHTPSQILGLRIDASERWLFHPTRLDAAARRYIREGESRNVPLRYKCRVRTPWWKLEVPIPSGFLGYLVSDRPRMAANGRAHACTNNLHRVDTPEPFRLAAAFANPVTFLAIEAAGRVYGGGVLKIEPGDSKRIPVPPLLPPVELAERLDRLWRRGEEGPALEASARWLASAVGCREHDLRLLAAAWRRLRDARLASGRRGPRSPFGSIPDNPAL